MPVSRSLYFDIRGYVADSVLNRSVEYVRVGAYARSSIVDQIIQVPLGQSFVFTGVEDNSMTMVKSPLPVDITVTTPYGVLFMPAQRLMILNCSITSLLIENRKTGASGYSGMSGYSGFSGYSGIDPNTIETDIHILHT
jgi:hypothetical protein